MLIVANYKIQHPARLFTYRASMIMLSVDAVKWNVKRWMMHVFDGMQKVLLNKGRKRFMRKSPMTKHYFGER